MTLDDIERKLNSKGGTGVRIIKAIQHQLGSHFKLGHKPKLVTNSTFNQSMRQIRDGHSEDIQYPLTFIKYGHHEDEVDNRYNPHSRGDDIEIGTEDDFITVKAVPTTINIGFYILSGDVLDLISFDEKWRVVSKNPDALSFRLSVLSNIYTYEVEITESLSGGDKEDYIEDLPVAILEGSIKITGHVFGNTKPYIKSEPRVKKLNGVPLEQYDASQGTSTPNVGARTQESAEAIYNYDEVELTLFEE